MTRTYTWAERLTQIEWDYSDRLCSPEAAIQRLMDECGFDYGEAQQYMQSFPAPADDEAA